ncbi:MAG: UbiA family prenyltransferase [Flavobacteriaceae bacterium]|nr:UbiA family prenyltransferase [Flavobacteriaceae bacterium]
MFFTFSLYVFIFFLISQEDFLKTFFDIKIHGIVFCSVLSIAAGGLINQFYDKEKDKIVKPFRSQFQRFLKQKYFLYFYLIFNILSLGIAWILSYKIFLFFLNYQFLIWFYSHKLCKKLIINNLSYVLLSLYPFFGILIYYQHFSINLFLLTLFLFILLLIINIIKNLMTEDGDRLLEYKTLPVIFGKTITIYWIRILLILDILMGFILLIINNIQFYSFYFILSILFFGMLIILLKRDHKNYLILSIFLKIWVFIGILFMLFDTLLN